MSADSESTQAAETKVTVLLYSDNSHVREDIKVTVGRRARAGQPRITWHEAATAPGARSKIADTALAAIIVDGETKKVGGLALCREIKTEVYNAPPVLAIVARPQDEWLGQWSEADKILTAPVQPRDLQEAVAELIDRQLAKRP